MGFKDLPAHYCLHDQFLREIISARDGHVISNLIHSTLLNFILLVFSQ